MRRVGNMWSAIKLLGAARDLAVDTRQLAWNVTIPCTLFLQTEHCDVNLAWHKHNQILAKLELQGGFGWQWAADQDAAGVYIVAKRKPLIGGIGRGKLSFTLPHGIHISLKLENCQLCCQGLHTSLELPPFQ